MSGTSTPAFAEHKEDKKPIMKQSTHIILKVMNMRGNEMVFRIKRSTPLKMLMMAYCEHKSLVFDHIRFVYNGRLAVAEQTPEELEMNDGDVIHVLLTMFGCGCGCYLAEA